MIAAISFAPVHAAGSSQRYEPRQILPTLLAALRTNDPIGKSTSKYHLARAQVQGIVIPVLVGVQYRVSVSREERPKPDLNTIRKLRSQHTLIQIHMDITGVVA